MAIEPLDYARPARRQLPVSRLLLLTGIAVLCVGIGGSALMPTLNRSRDGCGNFGKCKSNLRQIGLAIRMYANDNHDAFPASLGDVLLTQEITSDVFVCPASNDQRAVAPTTQQSAALLLAPNGHHCSYFYVGDGLTEQTVKDHDVIAFELPANHGGMVNVLFGDMHVEWFDGSRNAADAARIANLQSDDAAGVRPIWLRP